MSEDKERCDVCIHDTHIRIDGVEYEVYTHPADCEEECTHDYRCPCLRPKRKQRKVEIKDECGYLIYRFIVVPGQEIHIDGKVVE